MWLKGYKKPAQKYILAAQLPLQCWHTVKKEVMKTICIKTKIKKDLIEEVRVWFQTLKERMNETLQSLENEGVIVETAFLDKQGDELYLIYYMKAEDISRAYEIFTKSDLAIDHYHKSCWKKYCEGREVLEELLDIDRFESIKFYK